MSKHGGGHWYTYPHGETCHETYYAGTARWWRCAACCGTFSQTLTECPHCGCGEMSRALRNVTLRDARKWARDGTRIILPSVTSIQSDSGTPPGLVRWKVENAVECALTLKQADGEPADEFKRRVMEDADRQSRDAMDLGTRVHEAIDAAVRQQVWRPHVATELLPYVTPAMDWYRANVKRRLRTEHAFACADGYGGTIDLFAELQDGRCAVVDWKTYGSKAKYAAYWEHGEQLAAYALAMISKRLRVDAIINVGISTRNPGEVVPIEHGNYGDLCESWLCVLTRYQLRTGYDPVKEQDKCRTSIR